TPLSKQKTLYVNLNLDVLYLRNSPRLSNIKLIRALYITNYTPFRSLRLDTRRINGDIWDWVDDVGRTFNMIPSDNSSLQSHLTSYIKSLLKQVWYFSSTVEFLELIVDENQDTPI